MNKFCLLFLSLASIHPLLAQTVTINSEDLKYSIDIASAEAECMGPVSESVTITDLVIPNTVPYDGKDYPVTKIGAQAFYQCTKIKGSLSIGSNVKDIESWAFNGCSSLTGELIIPNSVEYIRHGAFWYCSGFTSLVLGKNVKEIGTRTANPGGSATVGKTFAACSGIKSIICYANEPPTMMINNGVNLNFGTSNWDAIYSNATLYVPEESINLYKSAPEWTKFLNVEIAPSIDDGKDEKEGAQYGIIFMEPGQQLDIRSYFDYTMEVQPLASITEYYEYESSDPEVVDGVSADGSIEAKKYGMVYLKVSYINQKDNTKIVNNFMVFVCPTLTLEDGNGVLYTHHVPYATRPTLKLTAGNGRRIAGALHDGEDITDLIAENDGKYIPAEPITANSVINLALEKTDEGPTTGADAVLNDPNIRILVDGHVVNIVGIAPGTVVRMYNLNTIKLFDEPYYPNIEVIDCGVYIIEIEGQPNKYKIVVR